MSELDLKLAALSKLVAIKSDAVDNRLSEEWRRVEQALQKSTDYDELQAALKTVAVLASKFHGAVVPLLSDFVLSIPNRALTYEGGPIPESRFRYRSASHLTREAIDAALPVRYVHTEALVDFLLALCGDEDKEISEKAAKALESLAEFDLELFHQGMGATPQAAIVAHLSKQEDAKLAEKVDVILRILREVLSPTMEGHSWTYNSMTISRGSIVSQGGVAELRAAAISLLKRMYPLGDAVSYRKRVLNTFDAATRQERPASNVETATMFERDAFEVLHFFRDLVSTEALPIVQAIEHQAYWDYYHAASEAVRTAALGVRDALAEHAEYQIYKQLIGFEGIFGDWEELSRSEDAWDYSNNKRQAAAQQYVNEINDANYELWRDRILEFAKTESDDLATFPVFYEFLKLLAVEKPRLALELITQHEDRMRPFLIPLVGGLWSSDEKVSIEAIVRRWIEDEDGEHLTVIAKSIHTGGVAQLGTLSSVISRATDLGNRYALAESIGVATSLYGQVSEEAKTLFMQALRGLAQLGEARWVNMVWFSRDFAALVANMNGAERAEILASMKPLRQLDFHAEEVLARIADQEPEAVLNFLLERLREEEVQKANRNELSSSFFDEDRFESIPHQLNKLNKVLAKNPDALLSALRRDFDPEDAGMYPYGGGARLIQGVYPMFDAPLQEWLLKLIESGDPGDLEFAIAIVRTFGGGSPIENVCKAIIKAVPERSDAWNEVAAALETTGVVSGEFGMATAFERKRDEMIVWKQDDNERVRAFSDWLMEILNRMIEAERRRAEEGIALRKHKYGIGQDDV